MTLLGKKWFLDEVPERWNKSWDPNIFITHAHSDHTRGIRRVLKKQDLKVLCSEATATILGITQDIPREKCEIVSPGDELDLGSCKVHVLDANHCIGALMFVFETENEKWVYTGDFRLNREIRNNFPLLEGADICYVDTTFDAPHYIFPPQKEAISDVLRITTTHFPESEIFLAVYTIGKEKVLQTISRAHKTKIWAPERLRKIYNALGMDFLTDDESVGFFALPRNTITNSSRRGYIPPTLANKIDISTRIIPTGFACLNTDSEDFFWVPYSEHNDFPRLRSFLKNTSPKRIVPI